MKQTHLLMFAKQSPGHALLCLTVIALLSSGNGVKGSPPPPNLIPLKVLFDSPVRKAPLISPDGQKIAYLAPDEKGVLNIWVRTRGRADDRMVSRLKRGPSYGRFFWQYDSRHLIYFADQNGDENTHLYQLDLHTRSTRDLTPFKDISADVVATSSLFPDQMLVAINLRKPEIHDVYRIDLRSGKATLDTENPGDVDYSFFRVDSHFQIRAAMGTLSDNSLEIRIRDTPKSPWHTIQKWGTDDNSLFVTGIVGFTPDDRGLYLTSSVGANAARFVKVDLATGQSTVLAEDKMYDVEPDTTLLQPTRNSIEAIRVYRERGEWVVLDPSLEADFRVLRKVRDGDFEITSRDLKEKTWIVSYTPDDGPVYFYAYDRASRKAAFLFSDRPALEKYKLAKMKSITFQARDGMTIYGYLTLPPGESPRNLPLVVYVHGGPWVRDVWGFDRTVQWLANRGYGVLQINYRGSAGYGKAYLNAGNREWGAKMNTDLIDGKDWAVRQGLADPRRVAIYGYSYGGYAVLAALAFTPDEFACGIDLYGPSSLVSMIKSDPPYYKVLRSLNDQRVGNVDTEVEFLNSRSPIFKVDQIKAPLLVGQGANDVRVTQAESDRMVAALKARGRSVEYLLFPNEGHGGWRAEDYATFTAAAEKFLAKHLGRRAEQ